MNKLGYAALAATTAFAATAASAAPTIFFNGISGTFQNRSIVAGAFTDTLTFDVANMGIAGATITSISVDTLSDLDFTSVTLNDVEFLVSSDDAIDFRSLRNVPVTAGTQTLVVRGVSGGNAAYSGTLAFTAGAVPEPASWAMMIAGFGLVGGTMRRRAAVRVTYV